MVFFLIIFFLWMMVIMFVFFTVFSRCVMIIVVRLIMIRFNVFCTMCLDLVLSVFVVLFSSKICGFFKIVLVMVIFCFWLLESWVLWVLMSVFSFWM